MSNVETETCGHCGQEHWKGSPGCPHCGWEGTRWERLGKLLDEFEPRCLILVVFGITYMLYLLWRLIASGMASP